jgi:GT2 family glycosyltransferase/glycosyltransferase involved in cell wall biosynthesis
MTLSTAPLPISPLAGQLPAALAVERSMAPSRPAAPRQVHPGQPAAARAEGADASRAGGPGGPYRSVVAVIVHHRGIEMLDTCLRSLLGSENVELEVVVVLNHCLESLPAIAEESPRVHLLRAPRNLGFGEANNFAVAWIERTLGPPGYFYFLNNDTESCPGTLAALVACLAAHPEAAIAGPKTLIQTNRGHINSLGLNVTEDAWGWDEGIGIALADYGELPGLRPVLAVTGSALLMEAKAFARVGGWTELYDYYFEDIDLGIKTWKSGRQVLYTPDATIYHRVSATMTVGAERKFFYFWRNRLLLAGVHWPLGRLARVLRRAVVDEVWKKQRTESDLQRRALLGALRKLPQILRWRWRWRGTASWWSFLRPAGSVPPISLPRPEPEPEEDFSLGEFRSPALGEAAAGIIPEAWLSEVARSAPAAAGGRRLLVLGWAPLPFENQRFNAAPGGRTWHFARTLAEAGHIVTLVAARMPGAYFEEAPAPVMETVDGVRCLWLNPEVFEDPSGLGRLVEALGPEALIGAAPMPSLCAIEVAGELPVWVDLFGDPMAEGQAREALFPEVEVYPAYSRMLSRLLTRGDVFSAVSERQRLALIGQLGLVGRLRGECADYDFVRVLPCAAEPSIEAPMTRGRHEDFIVLWNGGFNTWCDVPTLVRGLERAMAVDASIRFVATGAEIVGHDDRTAAQMHALVAASPYRERIELLGQLSKDAADALLRRADVALVTEKKIYERELGASGRISNWLAAGKAVICSDHSELGRQLSQLGLVLSYPPGDADALAERLVTASRQRVELAEIGRAARLYSQDQLAYRQTAEHLLAWADAPQRAPNPPDRPEIVLRIDSEQAMAQTLEQAQAEARVELALAHQTIAAQHHALAEHENQYHALRAELGRIHHSRMWRWWMLALDLKRRLLRR